MDSQEGDDPYWVGDSRSGGWGGGGERESIPPGFPKDRKDGLCRVLGMSWMFLGEPGVLRSRNTKSKSIEMRKPSMSRRLDTGFSPCWTGVRETRDQASWSMACELHLRWTSNTWFWQSALSRTLHPLPSFVGYCFRRALRVCKWSWQESEAAVSGEGWNAVNILSVCFYLARNLLFS